MSEMVGDLAKKECIPCKGGMLPLKGNDLTSLLKRLETGWQLVQEHHLEKEYKFENFALALEFTNKVGNFAETIGHHPDINLSWGKVSLTIWTHKVDGLTENDFIFAAKADQLL